MTTPVPKHCSRCGKELQFLQAYVKMTIVLKGFAQVPPKRYCAECCADPSMAVMFMDVMEQHVERIELKSIWD